MPERQGEPNVILAKTEADWLKQYLKDQGGALTIVRQLMVVD
jgi:hypothetical protein